MIGVVLLYVGVVLIVNGIWLIGAARAAAIASRMPTMETAAVGSTYRGGGYAGDAAAGQELGGESRRAALSRRAEASPLVHPEPRDRDTQHLHRVHRAGHRHRLHSFWRPRQYPGAGLAVDPQRRGHPAVRLHLSVGGVQPVRQRRRAGARLVLLVRRHHRDRVRRLHGAEHAGHQHRRPVAGRQLVRLGSAVGHVLGTADAGTADRPHHGVWWPSSKACGTSWALAIALLWGKLAFA